MVFSPYIKEEKEAIAPRASSPETCAAEIRAPAATCSVTAGAGPARCLFPEVLPRFPPCLQSGALSSCVFDEGRQCRLVGNLDFQIRWPRFHSGLRNYPPVNFCWSHTNLCRPLFLPLQSGDSDSTCFRGARSGGSSLGVCCSCLCYLEYCGMGHRVFFKLHFPT